ncbi:MAG: saccharopine dehydrogenase NADP-binding domain-containing protein [Chitinophagales bacterium]|nr:saccharopine dehydrogenase NADP-binding domain-containing protein [Chitinophagales bacterium]
MRQILILGAGKSSVALIDYLIEKSAAEQWLITVADMTAELALQKTKNRPNTQAISFDFYNEESRKKIISGADIVVSMLPALMHVPVAEDCLLLKKHLVTPSYISEAMRSFDAQATKKGLVFMNEIGLDPGIDHMSAMQMIDNLKEEGKTILGFKSHCGGLVAPESDDNLWHYKFSWNPRNVVLAGQGEGEIQWLENGKKKVISYEVLFTHTEEVKVKGFGKFESYPNRDSLKYISEYGLKGIKTMYRGTLRRAPFCKGWNALVQLGFTNRKERLTHKFQEEVTALMKSKEVIPDKQTEKLVLSTSVIPALFLHHDKWVVPADLLQYALEHTWTLLPHDRDMVVMVHQIEFAGKSGRGKKILESSMVCIGTDAEHTAMAKTVGLPVAMVTRMILNGEIKRKGVLMPVYPEIYTAVLTELKEYGIEFKEKVY